MNIVRHKDEVSLAYLTEHYLKADDNEKGILAIQAFILAGEIGFPVPDWSMQEIGGRLSNYFRSNYETPGYKVMDSFFEVNGRIFQKMRTNTFARERTEAILQLKVMYGLSTQQAILAAKKAGLPVPVTNEGKSGNKTDGLKGQEHAFNRTEYAAMYKPFKNAMSKMKHEDFTELSEHFLSKLPIEARRYIEKHRKKQ